MDSSYEKLVTLLCNGINHRKLYFNNHPKVLAATRDFTALLKTLNQNENSDSFFLGVVDGNLVHDGHYLVGPTIVGKRLIDFAVVLHSGGFLFRNKLEASEVGEFLALASELSEPTRDLKESKGLLTGRGVTNIDLSPEYEDSGWFGQFIFEGTEVWGGQASDEQDLTKLVPVYQNMFSAVEQAHGNAGSDREVNMSAAKAVSEKLLQSTQGNFMDIMQLVRYPDYDSYTVGHSVRVALILVLIGHRAGMDQEFLLELGTAGLLHDVGKAKIPEEILFKQGRLTAEERRIIENHPRLGAQILLENKHTSPLVIAAAWGHHLRYDGAGYPPTASWATRGQASSLLHVCDVFEALTAVRPYKPAITPRQAYEIMLQDIESFDPSALSALITAMGIYPPGSQVLLSSGLQGLVVASGAELDRPHVQLLRDQNGEILPKEDAKTIDLSSPEAMGINIVRLLTQDQYIGSEESGSQVPAST